MIEDHEIDTIVINETRLDPEQVEFVLSALESEGFGFETTINDTLQPIKVKMSHSNQADGTLFFNVFVNNSPAGFVAARPDQEQTNTWDLTRKQVLPEYQGNKISVIALLLAIEYMKARQSRSITKSSIAHENIASINTQEMLTQTLSGQPIHHHRITGTDSIQVITTVQS